MQMYKYADREYLKDFIMLYEDIEKKIDSYKEAEISHDVLIQYVKESKQRFYNLLKGKRIRREHADIMKIFNRNFKFFGWEAI